MPLLGGFNLKAERHIESFDVNSVVSSPPAHLRMEGFFTPGIK
jgi:hypothetical protein